MGSTFTVNLPAIATPDAIAGKAIPEINAAWKPRRVLIVEDNEDARELLSILLHPGRSRGQMAN